MRVKEKKEKRGKGNVTIIKQVKLRQGSWKNGRRKREEGQWCFWYKVNTMKRISKND